MKKTLISIAIFVAMQSYMNAYSTNAIHKIEAETINTTIAIQTSLNFSHTYIQLFEKIQKIISEHIDITPSSISLNDHFYFDLGADSLYMFEILSECEDEFDVELIDGYFDQIRYVRDLCDLIYYRM